MLKRKDIHIGKLLRYDLHTNARQESFIVIVVDMNTDGFWINFHDGDRYYVWYKFDMGKYKALEVK